MSRQSKDPVQKCHSDPGAASTTGTPCSPGKRIPRRLVPGIPSSSNTRKCVLTLDGYSYVIGEYRITIRLELYLSYSEIGGWIADGEGKSEEEFLCLSFRTRNGVARTNVWMLRAGSLEAKVSRKLGDDSCGSTSAACCFSLLRYFVPSPRVRFRGSLRLVCKNNQKFIAGYVHATTRLRTVSPLYAT
ncbi:unnamed protein product [Heterotrigona itama]|uniref:Uncharacterized protein n=1 Tax=Heterotrigona itama TaxID=395501 RepID=A0A6V7GZX0_9HYME|nr:unnamed protein product [Heterotrigona itama]